MDTFISLCMIVKNEEKTLARCLESVKDLVDEIIVVDTGSTDKTKEIAFNYTLNVYDFTWIKDFSAARNEGLRKATGKWILVLDADEYVQKEEHTKLREYLSTLDPTVPQGFLLPIMNILGENEAKMEGLLESSAARLFPNLQDIYYSRPIHEQLTYTYGELNFTLFPFTIYHSGYTNETVQFKDKSKRNLEIFENIQHNNQKLDPYYCFTLGNEYSSLGNHKKAIYYYERAYKRATPTTIWLTHCMDSLINNHLNLNQFIEAYQLIKVGLQRWGGYADYHYYMGHLYDYFGLYEHAKQEYLTCIQIDEEATKKGKSATIVKSYLSVIYPSRNLANIYYKEHNMTQAVFYLSKLLHNSPQDMNALYKLFIILSQSETDNDIITFLEKLFPSDKHSNTLLLFRISLMGGNVNLARYYFEKVSNSNTNLGESDLLHYSLLINDPILFEQTFKQTNKEVTEDSLVYKFLLLGTLNWKNTSFFAIIDLTKDHSLFRIAQSIQSILAEEKPAAIEEEDQALLVELITDLFSIRSFDAFDLLINQLSNEKIINSVANYFYSINQLELAIDYYSILLENNSLLETGFENLAFLYLNQGEVEDGLQFLEKAIELNPANPPLYLLLNKYCNDPAKKKMYKEQFIYQFPRNKGLPFITSM